MGKDKEKKPKAEKGEKKAKPFKVPKLHSPRKEKDQGDEAAVKIVSPRHPLPEGISLTILKEGDSHSFPHHNSTYVGFLLRETDGEKEELLEFERGEMFVGMGKGEVVPGLEMAVRRISKGTKAEVKIPPEFGYGEKGKKKQKIPPGSTLLFRVKVLNVYSKEDMKKKPRRPEDIF